jgi:integrase
MSSLIRKDWPRVRTVLENGRRQFIVDSRKTGFQAGRREFFERKELALQRARTIAAQVHQSGTLPLEELSPSQRRDAAEAIAALASFDEALARSRSPLLDAARHYIGFLEERKKRASVPSFDECLDDYLLAKRAEHDEFERTRGKTGIAQTTIYELEAKARIFRKHFANRKITDLDRRAVQEFLTRLKVAPRTKVNIRTKLSQFLNHCRRRGWIAVNPVEDVDVLAVREEVRVLSVEEIERLLRVAEHSENPATVLPYLAVSVFCGLRPGEAQQLRWENIHFETGQLEVRGITSKVRESRFVEMEPTLIEWLLPYRHRRGRIIGYAFVRDWQAVREKAGFTFGDDDRNPWPVDVLRHCYGSYWLAVNADRAKLAENMSNSVEVIRRNYRKAIPRKVAEAFWALRPLTSAKGKLIALPVAS